MISTIAAQGAEEPVRLAARVDRPGSAAGRFSPGYSCCGSIPFSSCSRGSQQLAECARARPRS